MPNVEHPDFFKKMDRLVELNCKLVAIDKAGMPGPLRVRALRAECVCAPSACCLLACYAV